MSTIRVTCPGCHARFEVNAGHAGKEGPCPKCKVKIRIPKEEVVIHAPVTGVPKDTQGQSIVKPITRTEFALTRIHITLITVSIIGFFLGALILRLLVEDKSAFPAVVLWAAAIVIALPIVFAAYSFLRDVDLGGFVGKELWMRVAACSAGYALLWFAMPIAAMAFDNSYEMGSWAIGLGVMLAAGGAIGMLSLDLDYTMGVVHYGMYLGCCLLGRLIVGIGTLPGMLEAAEAADETVALWLMGLPEQLSSSLVGFSAFTGLWI